MATEPLSPYHKGVIWVLISAFSFGFLGIFAKCAYNEGITLLTLLFLRFSFATLIMVLYTRLIHLRLALSKRNLCAVLALGGLFYAGQAFGFFQALRYLSVGVTSLILYTHIVFVTLIALYVLGEEITRKIVIALISALGGVFFIVYADGMEVSLTGVAFILASSIIYSVYITVSRLTVRNADPRVMGVYVMGSAAVTFFTVGLLTDSLAFPTTTAGLCFSLLIALIPTVIAIVTFFEGLRLVGASRASIISTIEPVVAVVFGFLLLGEVLSLSQILGGALILASVFILRRA
jgi:drug/metabolite transporter (DMT)-like permease